MATTRATHNNTSPGGVADDFPEYCYRWLVHRPRGLVSMPVEKFTKEYANPQILQWDGSNFDQVKAALVACRKRQPHEAMVIPRQLS